LLAVTGARRVRCQALDELDVEEFRHGGANITGFRLVNTSSATGSGSLSLDRRGAESPPVRWQSTASDLTRPASTPSVHHLFIDTACIVCAAGSACRSSGVA